MSQKPCPDWYLSLALCKLPVMKKLLLLLLPALLSTGTFAQEILKYCGADELRIETLQKNPEIAKAVIRRDSVLEAFTANFVNDFYANRTSSAAYIIPVVFH